jgi:hypothetical protein
MASIQLKVDAFEWDEKNERECRTMASVTGGS